MASWEEIADDDTSFNNVTDTSNRVTIDNTEYYITRCCECGVEFAFPEFLEASWRKNNSGFHCVNGHPLHFSQTTTQQATKAAADKQLMADHVQKITEQIQRINFLEDQLEMAEEKLKRKRLGYRFSRWIYSEDRRSTRP